MPDGRPDVGPVAQRAAEKHVAACDRAEELCEELPLEEWPPSPAVGPYCACDTCTIREALAAAWPVIVDDVAELLRRAGHPAAATVVDAEVARIRRDVAPRPSTQEAA